MALPALSHPILRSPFRHRSATNLKRDSSNSTKLVVAHHMVGNTYPYTIDNWAADIALAHESGLDGFALNVGSDEWQPARVADAYQAAENSGTGFKLFISFDMSALPCSTASSAETLRSYITTYASHPNQCTVDGQVFASTFSGSDCTFGQGSAAEGWQTQFLDQLTGANAVHFVPSFFVDPSTFTQYDGVMNGALNWNGAWPVSLTPTTAASSLSSLASDINDATFSGAVEAILNSSVGSFDTDTQWLSGVGALSSETKTYIATVSPWFYTHYGPDSFNKNWIYLADYWLYNKRWETLVANRDNVDVVEIVTWNDYGESHYIGPIEGAQPNSQAWVDGMNHTGWLAMTNHYATAFRTGSYPEITTDQLYMWARPHPKNADASNDPVGKPTSYQLTQDLLWAVVFATEPSTVTLTTAPSVSQTFAVPAGVTKLSMALTPGSGMSGTITRNGATVVDVQADGFTFNANPTTYNYNAFVAYSTSG
ncbi:glycoside hydrolase family 71 protein [Wolfiporia cocos MD-104 SS10]|uniref:Glycoside hydrolase family 71 protein n=1 Tax=Wolfiporia cocos (strain MD-104) TaxID=742152 RepID=A0A2H3JCW3_WOLCO|nr:glycoside hydrolase family 71 protein [Wolfiporia cocos MD-104 SS10]